MTKLAMMTPEEAEALRDKLDETVTALLQDPGWPKSRRRTKP